MKMRPCLMSVLIIIVIFLSVACSSNTNETSITIYDGQYSEMQIMHQIIKQLIEAQTEFTVDIKNEMSHLNSFNEILRGNSDLMLSYDGTVLTTYFGKDPMDVPDNSSIYSYANDLLKEKGLRLLDKLGFNNTYCVAMRRSDAERYSIKSISDLAQLSKDLIFGAEHDFFQHDKSGKYYAMNEYYELDFRESKQLDILLKYTAIESNNIDVTVVYMTDGLNRKADLLVLEDDKHFFPDYFGAILISDALIDRASRQDVDLIGVLGTLDGMISNVDMTNLTYAVDVEAKSAEEVARLFLLEKGLIVD